MVEVYNKTNVLVVGKTYLILGSKIYETPHYSVFSSLLLFPVPYVDIEYAIYTN
jgi:hypothetical protein